MKSILFSKYNLKDHFSKLTQSILYYLSNPPYIKESVYNPSNSINRKKFESLKEQWQSETKYSSTVQEMCTHPSYQQIIGMGKTALPYIFQELSCEIDHWFWALKAITCEDPVNNEDKGNLERMANSWLAWGAKNGYISKG